MSTRTPGPPSEFEAEGIPDPGFLAENEQNTGQLEGQMEVPRDVPLAADDFGTTQDELSTGEPLDGRLAREEPEVLAAADRPADESPTADTPFAEGSGQGIGRLVDPDEGARSDTEKDMVGTDVGTDLGGYSAEESAMHLEPEA
jgi:hypothetical protein